MNKEKLIRCIKSSKCNYDSIEIPQELKQTINVAIKEKKEKRMVIMKSKKRYGYTIGVAVASLFICFIIGLNTNKGFALAMENIPIIGRVSRVLTFRNYEESDSDKEVKIEVPQIQDSVENQDTNNFIVDVNKEINNLMNQYKLEAEKNIAEYKEAFLETGGTKEEFAKKGIKVDASYEVKYETKDVLSMVITANESWMNAHNVQYFYNINLKDGTYITLKDLLGTDYKQKINESILKQMQKRMEEDENLEYWDGSNGIEGFQTITDDTKFYINKLGNPVIVFAPYEVAPGAYGIQEFEIAH